VAASRSQPSKLKLDELPPNKWESKYRVVIFLTPRAYARELQTIAAQFCIESCGSN
jgi:hypothetical protein